MTARHSRPGHRRALGLALLGLCAAPSASAHDFWVQPEHYWLQPATAISMTLQVGHGAQRQRSRIPSGRITRFEAIAPSGRAIDLRHRLQLGGTAGDGTFRLDEPGAHVLVLETDDKAKSHLPAARFNDYLAEEGLTPAQEHRRRTGTANADGSETYGRRTKAIVLVGPSAAGLEAQVTKPVGLTLEIVPEVSPFAQPRLSQLPIRVYYEGRPLAGALVKLTDLEQDETPLAMHRTDRTGRATFAIPRAGPWLLNVVWTRPLPRSRETDFETLFSSLSFAIPPERN